MKIAIVHDWPVHFEQEYTWRDGLCAAIKELNKKHGVKFFVCGETNALLPHPYFPIYISNDLKRDVAEFKPDVILCWGDCTRPNAEPLSELKIPMALCFAGGSPEGHTQRFFQHFFVESQVYKEAFERLGCSVSTAFGTNTKLFSPVPEQAKIFDVCFPATYAGWKRHHIYAEATKGLLSVTAGFQYPDGPQNYVLKSGSLVLPHISAETTKAIYAASKTCCITSFTTGGSQRTVLEAMAMNVPLIVMKDSDKTSEYVYEAGEGLVINPEPSEIRKAIEQMMSSSVHTRDYIMSKWSEYKYAEALEKGLCELVS